MAAVVIYDWSLTFPDEIRLIWRNKLTRAKVLFLVNRYFFIIFYIIQAAAYLLAMSNAVSKYVLLPSCNVMSHFSSRRGRSEPLSLFRTPFELLSHIAVLDLRLLVLSLACCIA